MESKFALLWRRGGSDGIIWYIRGVCFDGSFYGCIRHNRRRCTTYVNGILSPNDAKRCQEILRQLQNRPVLPPGPCFALLAKWTDSLGKAKIILKYDVGDEGHSKHAKAFVELKNLLKRKVSKFYKHLRRKREVVIQKFTEMF